MEGEVSIFGHWQDHQVDLHNAKVCKPRTAKAHNMAQGVGEVDLSQPPISNHALVSPPETKLLPREKDLHRLIIAECTRRGWDPFHASTHKRSTLTRGAPDFIIAASEGRTFYIEVKLPGGKLREEQRKVAFNLSKNGHEPYLVTSFDEFLEVIKE